ncbi:MAG TPA: prepilin-type N-terminal cleavage/methylation domain-containing protein [Planctomycetaceae bacterium]|nr:prepilin-type N-terminal cleavage/methylation domain-containing protein [Planctomycetaceae bacterium]
MKTRQGFTLIELLVAISIAAVLASLGWVMVKNFGMSARDAQTVSTIKKVDAAIQDRLEAMGRFFENSDRRAGTPRISPPVYVEGNDRTLWGYDGNNAPPRPVVELLARKRFQRKHLPMNFDEPGLTGSVSRIAGSLPTDPSDPIYLNENSESLYWFLTQGTQFGSEEVAVVDFIDREIADTDGDGLMEVVDGWGKPIQFYRWPTRLIRPRAMGTETVPAQNGDDPPVDINRAALFTLGKIPSLQQLKADPQDPTALIASSSYAPNQFETDFHTPNTWFAPLVVSAGPDGKFGLMDPVKDKTSFGHLAQPLNTTDPATEKDPLMDNITSHMLRVGGK